MNHVGQTAESRRLCLVPKDALISAVAILGQ
jgi:hypothetical protein